MFYMLCCSYMLGGGCYNLLADIVGMLILSQSEGLSSEPGGEEKGSNHNMISAAAHVVADALRALAVIVVAIVGLADDSANVKRMDAWIALILSITIILPSLWALAKALYAWYKVHQASQLELVSDVVMNQASSEINPHLYTDPEGKTHNIL